MKPNLQKARQATSPSHHGAWGGHPAEGRQRFDFYQIEENNKTSTPEIWTNTLPLKYWIKRDHYDLFSVQIFSQMQQDFKTFSWHPRLFYSQIGTSPNVYSDLEVIIKKMMISITKNETFSVSCLKIRTTSTVENRAQYFSTVGK